MKNFPSGTGKFCFNCNKNEQYQSQYFNVFNYDNIENKDNILIVLNFLGSGEKSVQPGHGQDPRAFWSTGQQVTILDFIDIYIIVDIKIFPSSATPERSHQKFEPQCPQEVSRAIEVNSFIQGVCFLELHRKIS